MGERKFEMNDVDKRGELAKEILRDAYADGGKPIVKPTGELVGLLPRTIKAALAPLEKWVLQREYNIEETKQLLEDKLKNVPPESIEPPEAHIAVPAIQYISYCMDNAELRDMYANLLANSINKVMKNGVHPGFVEIIKQLCPDEAKILRYMATQYAIPVITLRYLKEDGSWINVVNNFSNIGELTQCERPLNADEYFDNLIRLGLLRNPPRASVLTDRKLYETLESHPIIKNYLDKKAIESSGYKSPNFEERIIEITEYGKAFCNICISSN